MGPLTWGLIIAGTVALMGGAKYSVDSYNNKKDQERQSYVTNTLEPLLEQYETDIEAAFNSYQQAQNFITEYEYQLDVSLPDRLETYQEWVSLYEDMMKGEENLFSQQRDVLENNISIAESGISIAQSAISNYVYDSALEIEQIYASASETIGSARRQQALMNVSAGATGSISGAYSVANLKIQSDLVRYAGEDLVLNEGDGSSFAKAVMSKRNEIQLNIDELNQQLEVAKNSKRQAIVDLENWNMEMEGDYADMNDYIAQTNISILKTQQALANERKNLADASKTFLQAIKNYEDTAKELREDYRSYDTTLDVSEGAVADKVAGWKNEMDEFVKQAETTSTTRNIGDTFNLVAQYAKR